MSYQNVLVAVKIVFQNISVADLSPVLSYKLLHSISPLPPRQIDPLWSTPTLSWLFRGSLLFVAATYLCSFFERLFNVHSNIKQFHWISNWHDRNSQSHTDKTSDHHSDNTENRNCTMWKYCQKKLHLNGSHQVLSIWQNKNAQKHLITVHYVALLGIKGFKDP